MADEKPFDIERPQGPNRPGIATPQPTPPPARPTASHLSPPSEVRGVRRWLRQNYTGFYQSDHSRGGPHAALLIQLNQAGQTLVGWAVPPPIGIPIRSVKCFSAKSKQLSQERWKAREVAVVFVASLDGPSSQTISLWASPVSLATEWTKITDSWYLSADPSDIFARIRANVPPDAMQLGELRLGPPLQIQFNGEAPGFESLTQLSDLPRIPGFYGAMTLGTSFTAEPFHTWVSTHSRPLPVGYLDDEAEKLAPNQPTTSPLSDAINDWYAASGDKLLSPQLRAKIFKPLLSWVMTTTPGPPAIYRGRAKAALCRALAQNVVKVTDAKTGMQHSRYYREWVTLAYADEVTEWERNGRPKNHGFIPAIGDLGLMLGSYLYTFTFATGTALPLPKSITGRIPEPGKYLRLKLPGVAVGFNPFYMNVKKEKVTVVFDADGKPKIRDDGTIETSKREPLFDTAADSLSGLIGVFVDVGVGFPTPGVDVKSLEILTYNGTLTKESFDGATFQIGQVVTPSVSTSIAKAQGPVSVMFAVSNEANGMAFDLFTVVDIPRSAGLTTPKTTSQFFKTLLQPSRVLNPSWSLGSGGFAVGFLASGGRGTTTQTPPNEVARPAPQSEVAVRLDLDDFFDVDSHEIPASGGYLTGLYSRRNVLEASLAEYLAVIINPNATRDSVGWASPEGSAERNLRLSGNRARALAQAYVDAFEPGAVVAIAEKNIVGRGEAAALEPPVLTNVPRLQDPETALGMTSKDPAFAAAYKKWSWENRDQVRTWPEWRRAQLRIDGQVIISPAGSQNP